MFLFFPLLNFPLSPFEAEAAAWRRTQNLYQKDIRTGSSPTATVATENRWPSKNTLQQSWEEGTDRDLETKDVGFPICSVDKCP